MTIKAGYKLKLFLVCAITVAALSVLPFFASRQKVVYIYTENISPTVQEENFVNELNKLGYNIHLNSKTLPPSESIALWFRSPEFAAEIAKSPARYNFLYSKEYYPFTWRGQQNLPIVLTPYQNLYEHYMRANVKAALFTFESSSPHLSARRFDDLLSWLKETQNN